MKIPYIRIAVLSLLFPWAGFAADSQPPIFGYSGDAFGPKPNSVTFSAFTGVYLFGNKQELNRDYDEIMHMGVRGGYSFTKYIEAEGSLGFTPTRTRNSEQDVYIWGFNGVGQYPVNPRLTPYGTFGIGGIIFDDDFTPPADQDFQISYGVGLKIFLARNLALCPDVRAVTSFENTHTAGLFTLNLMYYAQLDPGATRDSDGDGVVDKFDKCPKQSETKNGYLDQDGCPDEAPNSTGDRDADGIPDEKDKCPDQPETVNGFEDTDGCPDQVPMATPIPVTPVGDKDHDGITDDKDKCPDQPETVNGFKDDDGCPDHEADEFQGVMDGIHFESGSPVIDESSYSLLDRAVKFLNKVPALNIKIEGHTDNTGTPSRNKFLAYQRAQSVQQYFAHKGIAQKRFEIRGYGPARPIASNKTAEGRSKNRRVEFKFLNPEVLPKE